jgi:hypothetical protein
LTLGRRRQVAGRQNISKLYQSPDMRERSQTHRRITIHVAHSSTPLGIPLNFHSFARIA